MPKIAWMEQISMGLIAVQHWDFRIAGVANPDHVHECPTCLYVLPCASYYCQTTRVKHGLVYSHDDQCTHCSHGIKDNLFRNPLTLASSYAD